MATTRSTKKATSSQRDTTKPAAPTPRKTAAKKPSPRKRNAKKTLPTRPAEWMTDGQGYAIVAARLVGIDTPRIQDWTDHRDGTVTRALRDGTLHYNTRTRTLRWQAVCRMGAFHTYRLDDPGMAMDARMRAATCSQPHADLTHIRPLGDDELTELGVHTGTTLAEQPAGEEAITETIPAPVPDRRRRALGDDLTRSRAAAADTQPLSRTEIEAGLAARADHDTPKEHPEP